MVSLSKPARSARRCGDGADGQGAAVVAVPLPATGSAAARPAALAAARVAAAAVSASCGRGLGFAPFSAWALVSAPARLWLFSSSPAAAALDCTDGSVCAVSGGGWLPFIYSGGMPWVTPGTPSGEQLLALARKLFLFIRWKTSSLSGSNGTRRQRKRECPKEQQHRGTMESAHALPQLFPRPRSLRTRRRHAREFQSDFGIRRNHIEIAARVVRSWLRQADSANSSRALWRKLRDGSRPGQDAFAFQTGTPCQPTTRGTTAARSRQRLRANLGRKIIIGLYRVGQLPGDRPPHETARARDNLRALRRQPWRKPLQPRPICPGRSRPKPLRNRRRPRPLSGRSNS